MYEDSTMGDATGPGYNEVDNARTSAKTMDNDKQEEKEDKIDITTAEKINKTPILISC